METFAQLQDRLGDAVSANRPGSDVDHVLIALPSFSVGESLLSHYADPIPALEHRYLVTAFVLGRIERCEVMYLCSRAPAPEVVDHYLSMLPEPVRADARARLHIVEVGDSSARAIAAKLLDRPDLLATIRATVGCRPALIEPWNVTADEVAFAEQVGVPIYGSDPALWRLGNKSSGRRIFGEAGVPVPLGQEDLHSVEEVVDAIAWVRAGRPGTAVVVKHDDSGSGDGNAVIPHDVDPREAVQALPEWYRADLAGGCVVEEYVAGDAYASPSVQLDITPDGGVEVLSTHEQVLGGPAGQVYLGCRFPADSPYAAELARLGHPVGDAYASRGARGRLSVDFAAARRGSRWDLYALEVNVRKGGTTHPYCVLRNLVPGRYDEVGGVWLLPDGSTRAYVATDNLIDSACLGMSEAAAIHAISEGGFAFDQTTGTGVVLHMLSCLAIDGRLGLTAIGRTTEESSALYDAAVAAIAEGCRASV